jgi:protein kinase-like protein/Leucine Rich Repeat (LRR) protein
MSEFLPTPSLDYDPERKSLVAKGMDTFPEEIISRFPDVEFLDMRHGTMTDLPDTFGELTNLKVALFSNNDFAHIPPVLRECDLSVVAFQACKITDIPEKSLPINLRGLSLANNHIRHLPSSIGDLSALQKLTLSDNELEALPDELLRCQSLELLRLQANRLEKTPAWIAELPRLSWYTDSNNPSSLVLDPTGVSIPRDEIEIDEQHVLGHNGRNTIYQGLYKGTPVAIKVYGANLKTNDVSRYEIALNMRLGDQANIVGSLGVVDQPESAPMLVMPLVTTEYQALGKPPSFDTLVRDTFDESVTFSPEFIANALRDVAMGAQHSHHHGVMHGDIYAHNILTDAQGHSILGDFGDATLYDPQVEPWREKFDVRGFGCLVDDLLRYAPDRPGRFVALRDACWRERPDERPSFDDIVGMLR